MKSLWLHPQRGAAKVELERFRDYQYFFESFEQYGMRIPRVVTVRWVPLRPLLEVFEDEVEEAPEFIQEVAQAMKRGADVPPVLLNRTRVFDGRHRAWAAWRIGIRKAPVVDVSAYWPKKT
jgi:hypothetical protein